MNKVYDIITPSTRVQTHCVVARSMGEAERLFLEVYPNEIIDAITLHAEYVILPKEENDA